MSSVDDGEVYDDGTAIKNISVSGVAKKAAMFEPKSGKTTPPVLRKFRGQQQINANGGDSTKLNQPEEKTTPSWVKKPVTNGAVPPKPDVIPKSRTSPVSPKPPLAIPKKTVGVTHKWSHVNSSASSTVAKSKETPVTNTFRKLSTDTNKPDSPVLKDINHNVKTQPLKSNSDIASGNKRSSVADLQKSFQSDSNSSSSETRATNVKPLKENTSPVETKQSEEVIRRTSNVSSVSDSKSSILDRIASLETSSGAKNITFNRKSMVTRKGDSKLFKRFIISKNDKSFDGPPPSKPPKLTDIDLEPIKAEYKQLHSKQDAAGFEDEDFYDDIGNVMSQFSVIQPMTEEEEYGDVGNVMADDMEEYDDCSTATAALQEPDEVYEPIDEEQAISGGSVSSKTKESEKERKKRDKEKKDQERKAKEELKKKEREEEITGSEPKQGEGIIREDCTGTKLDLSLKKGDRVDIIRMDKNPSGKWLVKATDGRWGYVDSSNVEVATSTIRQSYIGFLLPPRLQNIWMNDEQEYMVADDMQANGCLSSNLPIIHTHIKKRPRRDRKSHSWYYLYFLRALMFFLHDPGDQFRISNSRKKNGAFRSSNFRSRIT
ncbi:hypothetical protein LOTGIDRAFT_158006 [Lottia gigantea]|uniref:SH3 domain-containing protein n=1 Tax=Lottia gigantea TaxID=225164 RepID=V4ATT2_LOTGI|nr:hypothetical protein LOTGIDRAFT_158006 [Lottia gigantea]ESP00713.1 hypothetical protein LOTGIDRAFT_158006 [Lottia gigantea]